MWTLSSGKLKSVALCSLCLAVPGPARAAPVTSLNVVFNQTSRSFTAGISTNASGSGQVWVQAFTDPDAGQTIKLELLDNGSVVAGGMTPASLVTQQGVVTYGFPNTTPLPITFFRAGTGLTIRASVEGTGISKESATFDVVAGSAARILLLAPGLTHVPGTNPAAATGRSGQAAIQTPGQAFSLTAILTDMSYNKVTGADHAVRLASGDLVTLPGAAALSQGTADFSVNIIGARTARTFTAADLTDPSVLSGSVEVASSGPPVEEVFPFPNPFRPNQGQNMTFRFHLDAAAAVALKVKDAFGQPVWESGFSAPSGFSNVTWDGRNGNGEVVASGIYYVLLEVDGSVKSKKKLGVLK